MPIGDLSLAQALLAARRSTSPAAVPADDVPVAQAYAAQRAVHVALTLPVMVWKLGLTSEGARMAHGAHEPAVGRLRASDIFCNHGTIDFCGDEMFAEAELVFELGEDLPPRTKAYTRAEVAAALKGVWAGIEIVRTRFEHSELPLGLLIADNVMGYGLVLGDRLATGWEARFAAMPVTLTIDADAPVAGSTDRVMGDPLDALVWLANWLCVHGEGGLRAEQLVAAGSCTGVTEIHRGDTIVAAFDQAGIARVVLSA
ncbi:2-keto-4-pentenoate hydratase [Novosphingobium sp. AAP1]|uniref:2-keto-4-pentenoate hydratase n=1 Tax=Novosphingobium sp. AAP1 TaxID=1523413 RepID=UPI000A950822|nr:fumarylacetoacetate hydrolase family protein [Novosphingobium sp. AAP1]